MYIFIVRRGNTGKVNVTIKLKIEGEGEWAMFLWGFVAN